MASDSTSTSAPGPNLKLWGGLALVGLVLAAGLYFFGLSSGRAGMTTLRQEFGTREQGLQNEMQTLRGQMEQAREREALLRAQTLLYEASIDLEATNFGTANGKLQRAAQELRAVNAPAIGPVRERIAATDLTVAADVGTQRRQVIDFARQIARETPMEIESSQPSATGEVEGETPAAP